MHGQSMIAIAYNVVSCVTEYLPEISTQIYCVGIMLTCPHGWSPMACGQALTLCRPSTQKLFGNWKNSDGLVLSHACL